MTPAQLRRRAGLLARNDAALERWPDRAGSEFASEMSAVAAALEALAQAAADDPDVVECSRTWRWAGNAYFDLGAGKDRSALEHAAEAYRRAEDALEAAAEAADATERVKLNYCFGKALLQLSEGKDLGLATDARTRLQAALELARTHMPDGVASLQGELKTAEDIIALLGAAQGLNRRIDQVKNEIERTAATSHRATGASDIDSMLEVLNRQFEQEKPSLDPTRQAGLESLMNRLGDVVHTARRTDSTIEERVANRGKLEALKRELEPQLRRPSLKGGDAASGSRSERLLAALQELKIFVGSAGMAQGNPTAMREAAMDLFVRLGHLTTWISQAGNNAAQVHRLEYDQGRALAHEVRLYATRRHPLLALPIWPHVEDGVDANRVFFSGNARMLGELAAALQSSGLVVADAAPPGADFAIQRWHDLRTANVAVFDLTDTQPQVYYELGIALTIGAQVLLIATDDTEVPFDIAQNVGCYTAGDDLRLWLTDQVEAAIYGLRVRPGKASSRAATLAYAEQLAEADNALLGVALRVMRGAGDDAIKFRDALTTFNSYLGVREHEVLQSRWPAVYPEPHAPRNFAVMPFRAEREAAYAVIAASAQRAGVEPVRGDAAQGQEIIESIWQEIGRATHVTVDLSGFNPNVCLELGIADTLGRPTLLIGEQGTDRRLKQALPGVAKRRCQTYGSDPRNSPPFLAAVRKFFATP